MTVEGPTTYLITSETYLVTVAGSLDAQAAPGLADEVAALLEDGAREVVVDLTDVTTVGADAMELLVRTGARAGDRDASVTIVSDDAEVVRLVARIRVPPSVDVERTVSGAFARVATRARVAAEAR